MSTFFHYLLEISFFKSFAPSRRRHFYNSRYSIQYRGQSTYNLSDVFLLTIYGAIEQLTGVKDESYDMVGKCMNKLEIGVTNLENANLDYTRCDAEKQCPTTTTTTTSTTTTTPEPTITTPTTQD